MKRLIGTIMAAVVLTVPAVFTAPSAQAANYRDGISWYWIKNPDCPYGSRCNQMKVKASRTSCPDGLYVEVNFLDRRGNIVDYGNDIANSLTRGRTAILTFTTYEDSVRSAQLTKMRCY